uniref:Uncharacterized protein n=1 Tax=Meleagris gallopavo TaxID=9103 RepID=A0A803YFF9_MELGA
LNQAMATESPRRPSRCTGGAVVRPQAVTVFCENHTLFVRPLLKAIGWSLLIQPFPGLLNKAWFCHWLE